MCLAPSSPGTRTPRTRDPCPCCQPQQPRDGRDVWPVGAASSSCPRAQGSGKPFRPLCPGTGTAERRMRRPPLQFASVTHPDIYWQFTLRQKLKGEAGRGTPTGATRGSLADGWGHGFGRFDPSFLTELGPEERAPPHLCPSWTRSVTSGFSLVA